MILIWNNLEKLFLINTSYKMKNNYDHIFIQLRLI